MKVEEFYTYYSFQYSFYIQKVGEKGNIRMHILFCFYTPTEALTSQKVQIPYRGISGLRGKYHQRGIAGGIGGNANREVFLGALGEIPTEGYPWGHWGKC